MGVLTFNGTKIRWTLFAISAENVLQFPYEMRRHRACLGKYDSFIYTIDQNYPETIGLTTSARVELW